jgi:hypothetical protein
MIPTNSYLQNELKIIQQTRISFSENSLRVRDLSRIKGTCLYSFYYRSKTAVDSFPLVVFVNRFPDGPRFRYPDPTKSGYKSKAKSDSYVAAINLHYVSLYLKKYIIERYAKLPYVPLRELEKIMDITESYRIYDTRKIRSLNAMDWNEYLLLEGLTSDDEDND